MWPDEQARLIGDLPFMLDLPLRVQERVLRSIVEVSEGDRIEPGSVLFREGEMESDAGYVLLRGSVRVEKTSSRDAIANAPALLGELKQFHPEGRRSATVTTQGDVEALRFEWRRFADALSARLNDDELSIVREALRRYGWGHFMGEDL